MFINIMHKTFITEYPSKFSYITPEFFELHEEEDWHNGLKINVDFEEYLKNLSDTGTRQYKVYPIKDFNVFMKAYCHLLGLAYQEYREIINYNIFSLHHAEDMYGFPDTIISPMSEDEYGIAPDYSSVNRRPSWFPAEFAINCIDEKWARNKFHYFRVCDIVTEIKKYQRKEYEEYGIISDSFNFLKADNMTAQQLFDKDCYHKVYTTFKQRGYNTDLFDMSIEEYINNPDCTFGYNELNYYKFNTRLARMLQQRGYRIIYD